MGGGSERKCPEHHLREQTPVPSGMMVEKPKAGGETPPAARKSLCCVAARDRHRPFMAGREGGPLWTTAGGTQRPAMLLPLSCPPQGFGKDSSTEVRIPELARPEVSAVQTTERSCLLG